MFSREKTFCMEVLPEHKFLFFVAKHFAMVYPNVYESGLVGCHVSMEHGAVNRKVVGSIST